MKYDKHHFRKDSVCFHKQNGVYHYQIQAFYMQQLIMILLKHFYLFIILDLILMSSLQMNFILYITRALVELLRQRHFYVHQKLLTSKDSIFRLSILSSRLFFQQRFQNRLTSLNYFSRTERPFQDIQRRTRQSTKRFAAKIIDACHFYFRIRIQNDWARRISRRS